ncbi:hypothetical protein AMK16_02415 [Streptomyces sp. CB00455]|uniref:hypothetical protein n=1 Tax=Streptomyces sp. CB00455 TaxID=1703927 RepID=UPI00093AC512|nr:hypothetical protein [Streptomyces sp. CB00455]OKK22089.1 hypothetical protein AMK16_02415 [Streptomyces sp. CB00455]
MTMPPPPPSPGPYGPPPQPPHPYGGQQYGQQYGQPYGQHPPYPGPPPPQQPYGAPPYPVPGAWGQPPVGPPARRGRTGVGVAIVAASLVGLTLIGLGVNRLTTGGGSGSGFPRAEYRLTVPPTLLDGRFRLDQDLSQTRGKEALKGSYDPKIRDPKPAVGQYTAGAPQGAGVLVFSGMYGRFKDPAGARRKMLAGAAKADGARLAVPARDITPADSGITVSCEVLVTTQDGTTASLPVCAWADENTGASVAVVTPEGAQQSPQSVDLDKAAESTVKVRSEARQPIG